MVKGIGGKLGQYSNKSDPIIENQAEYSDKTENDMADTASRAEASMQLMEIGNGILCPHSAV